MRLHREPGKPMVMLQAGGWGVVAAMAMSGMRALTTQLGLVGQTPPEAMAKQSASGLLRQVPPGMRAAVIEVSHWGFGAVGGSLFGVLPQWLRRHRWTGPVYGLMVWLGFELGLAPILGLSQAKATRPVERAAFAADHVLFGLVLAKGLERRNT
ncbi:MAG: hypothetical protein JF887_13045 [Candidatus Dormibacteraeota bacterium]|uniref:DUF1440 domain-containing protein n=1 Tax=Candidatus Amunia macphersoniae TaxID=3127014 RepID=A0A934KPW8_9BACT|nr:hypothetical protein [Candidatus Dormibacteraeota bacterium]